MLVEDAENHAAAVPSPTTRMVAGDPADCKPTDRNVLAHFAMAAARHVPRSPTMPVRTDSGRPAAWMPPPQLARHAGGCAKVVLSKLGPAA